MTLLRTVDTLPVDYIVVAYRSARHIAACLDSIATDRPANSRIIVVDNDSPDESAATAKAHPAKPWVLTSPKNLGFGGACNLGLRESTAPLAFFLNPDARLHSGSTQKLADLLEQDAGVAATGPRIVDPGGGFSAASAGFEPSVTSVAGHFLLLGRVPGLRRLFRPLQLPTGTRERSPDWISGAAMMVRRSAFEEVGGFDAEMFMYMEDVDLCRRLRAAGWTIKYEPGAVVDHEIGGSQGSEQSERWYGAFHDYLLAHRGRAAAGICAYMAALGLGGRAAIFSINKPAHARRLAGAARTALRLALRENGRALRRGA